MEERQGDKEINGKKNSTNCLKNKNNTIKYVIVPFSKIKVACCINLKFLNTKKDIEITEVKEILLEYRNKRNFWKTKLLMNLKMSILEKHRVSLSLQSLCEFLVARDVNSF